MQGYVDNGQYGTGGKYHCTAYNYDYNCCTVSRFSLLTLPCVTSIFLCCSQTMQGRVTIITTQITIKIRHTELMMAATNTKDKETGLERRHRFGICLHQIFISPHHMVFTLSS